MTLLNTYYKGRCAVIEIRIPIVPMHWFDALMQIHQCNFLQRCHVIAMVRILRRNFYISSPDFKGLNENWRPCDVDAGAPISIGGSAGSARPCSPPLDSPLVGFSPYENENPLCRLSVDKHDLGEHSAAAGTTGVRAPRYRGPFDFMQTSYPVLT